MHKFGLQVQYRFFFAKVRDITDESSTKTCLTKSILTAQK